MERDALVPPRGEEEAVISVLLFDAWMRVLVDGREAEVEQLARGRRAAYRPGPDPRGATRRPAGGRRGTGRRGGGVARTGTGRRLRAG